MAQYYVTHSKYHSTVNEDRYENALIYIPSRHRSRFGTYRYEHNGKIIWTYDSSQDLFDYFKEANKCGYIPDYNEALKFRVYKKYSFYCQSFAKREY